MITILVGMIASGKSTLAREYAKNGSVVVSGDAIVTMVHGGNYKGYNPAMKPLYKSIEMQVAATAIAMGKDVVVDNCNLNPEVRARWVALARALDVPVECVSFTPQEPSTHALWRHCSDNRGLSHKAWLKVARRHKNQYVPPDQSEGFRCIEIRKSY